MRLTSRPYGETVSSPDKISVIVSRVICSRDQHVLPLSETPGQFLNLVP
jgi:hypothetical protein